ncbi:MAG TPA: hypothetical protein VF474_15060 [Phenylobacterium sp.]
MHTDVAPAAIRDQAMAICRRHGLGLLSVQRQLTAAGDTVFTEAVIDLERAFGICIEMKEIWRGATVPDLVALVEAKASDVHRSTPAGGGSRSEGGGSPCGDPGALVPANLVPANDYYPAEPAAWERRTPMVGIPPLAHAVRAQRIAAKAERRRFLRRLVVEAPALIGLAAGLLFHVIAPH